MFSKLTQLTKENIDINILSKAGVAQKDTTFFASEVSSSIVDVLKSQLESGKAEDLIVFFRNKRVEKSFLIGLIVNKLTHRLNKYYGLNITNAYHLSNEVVTKVMVEFVKDTNLSAKQETDLFMMLNWLSGHTVNFESFFGKLNSLKLA